MYCKSFPIPENESPVVSVTIAKYILVTKKNYVYYHYNPVKLRTDLTFGLFAGGWRELT